jgi:hypothetical protein
MKPGSAFNEGKKQLTQQPNKYIFIKNKLIKAGSTINEEKTTVIEVKKAIAKVGHDNDEVKSSKETYQKLPDCCQYDRTLQLK